VVLLWTHIVCKILFLLLFCAMKISRFWLWLLFVFRFRHSILLWMKSLLYSVFYATIDSCSWLLIDPTPKVHATIQLNETAGVRHCFDWAIHNLGRWISKNHLGSANLLLIAFIHYSNQFAEQNQTKVTVSVSPGYLLQMHVIGF